jgi:hypothetical protein
MRQSKQVGLLVVLFFLSVSQGGAWEFSMSGFCTWEYYQFSQLGDKGFFGPYNQDNSFAGTFANPLAGGSVRLAARNGWLGHEVASRPLSTSGDDLASGSDVAANYMYTVFIPIVKVNPALSMQGAYRIGSWLDPTVDFSAAQLNSSRYLNSQAPGIGQSFSPGYWQIWYVLVNLPWGTVQIGKQPNTIGLGTIIDSLENSSESVCLSIPFGPFNFSFQYYVWGPGLNADAGSSNYPLKTDRSGAAQPHVAAMLMYGAGNISSQTYAEYSNGHKGPESQLLGPVFLPPAATDPPKTPIFAVDCSNFFGFTNFRYFNGQLFFNAEVGFIHQIYRQNGTALNPGQLMTQFSPLPQTRYWELWAGMIECGAVAGPAKLSFLWAYYPGYDRRGGKLIDRQPTIGALFSPDGGVNVYFPYSLLLGYDYGSGNGSISRSSKHGFITDASTYGVRLDYAVAANLNAYATFLYASRVSQGYGWGWIRPNPFSTDSPALQYGVFGVPKIDVLPGPNLVDLSFHGANYTTPGPAPNILERDLGYEIGGGIDWKLIEGFTLTARVAYWRPGGWFKYACVDRRQPNWDSAPTASNMWGINPNREIDPIFGTRVALQVDF